MYKLFYRVIKSCYVVCFLSKLELLEEWLSHIKSSDIWWSLEIGFMINFYSHSTSFDRGLPMRTSRFSFWHGISANIVLYEQSVEGVFFSIWIGVYIRDSTTCNSDSIQAYTLSISSILSTKTLNPTMSTTSSAL